MTETLPDEVLEELRTQATLQGSLSESARLVAKYSPKPKRLHDYGPIRWRRTYKPPIGSQLIEGLDDVGGGIPIDSDGSFSRSGTVALWPEIEGSNPGNILRHGWQVRKFQDLPDDWDVLTAWGEPGWDMGGYKPGAIPNNLMVFARPPADEH